MILYHGSNTEIHTIDLSQCKPYKDFSQGFYLTTIKEQAQKMANRTVRIFGGTEKVSVFKLADTVFADTSLNIKTFKSPTEEWAKFVMVNRNPTLKSEFTDNNLNCTYDIVIGPVANDDLALLFRQFERNLITVDTLVAEMNYKKLTNQYSFHTQKAVAYLQKMNEEDLWDCV